MRSIGRSVTPRDHLFRRIRVQRYDFIYWGGEQYAATDQQCAGARSNHGREGRIDFAWRLGIQAQEVTPEFASRRLHVRPFTRSIWIAQPGNGGWRRDQLMQEPQALWL